MPAGVANNSGVICLQHAPKFLFLYVFFEIGEKMTARRSQVWLIVRMGQPLKELKEVSFVVLAPAACDEPL